MFQRTEHSYQSAESLGMGSPSSEEGRALSIDSTKSLPSQVMGKGDGSNQDTEESVGRRFRWAKWIAISFILALILVGAGTAGHKFSKAISSNANGADNKAPAEDDWRRVQEIMESLDGSFHLFLSFLS